MESVLARRDRPQSLPLTPRGVSKVGGGLGMEASGMLRADSAVSGEAGVRLGRCRWAGEVASQKGGEALSLRLLFPLLRAVAPSR